MRMSRPPKAPAAGLQPPVDWRVTPICKYTAAQLEGHEAIVQGPVVRGTVE